jgi:hypothetical protein
VELSLGGQGNSWDIRKDESIKLGRDNSCSEVAGDRMGWGELLDCEANLISEKRSKQKASDQILAYSLRTCEQSFPG